MSLRKVYGGTPIGNESRCDTCSFARIIQGYSNSEKIVICAAVEPAISVPFKVAECSSYDDKRLPDFRAMAQIAWQIRSKNAGRTAGFVKASELKKKQETEEADRPTSGLASENE